MNYYPSYNQYYNQMPKTNEQYQNNMPQYAPQYMPQFTKPTGLQGKSVDSLEVVKAMDIPLDGTVSYFPLTDGTAIVTKQLQQDGSSKTIVYKPVEETEKAKPIYVTMEELDKKLSQIDLNEIEDELQDIKKQIKNIKKNKED